MTNYNWNHSDHVLEFGIGVSCCPSPEEKDLVKIWNRHRKSLINLLTSLQGIHVVVEDMESSYVSSGYDVNDATVYISELDLTLKTKDYGHLWHLLPNGTYTVKVTVEGHDVPMTKIVRVITASFTEVVFRLPPRQAFVPKFIVLFLMASTFLVAMLSAFVCKCCKRNGLKRRKTATRPSYKGFQPLNKDDNLFNDDEEDNMELMEQSVEQYGLAPTKIYHDETSSMSSSSGDELDKEAFLHVKSSNGKRQQEWLELNQAT